MNIWLKFFAKSRPEKGGTFFLSLKTLLDFKPGKTDVYVTAFRHASDARNEQYPSYQRLEYLGDAILSAIVADYLYSRYPGAKEGFLTSMRSKIVNRKRLNRIGKEMQLAELIVSRFDKRKLPENVYGDCLEALIGAIYVDKGYKTASRFVKTQLIHKHMDIRQLQREISSYKGNLIEWTQAEKKSINFSLTDSWGESHRKNFRVKVFIDGEEFGMATASSKKKAEEMAAHIALNKINKG